MNRTWTAAVFGKHPSLSIQFQGVGIEGKWYHLKRGEMTLAGGTLPFIQKEFKQRNAL